MKIIIIGAGPGGYETAALAAARGIEVVLISEGPLGGTCLNEGCIPTKTLCAMDAPDQAHKQEVIAQLQAGIAQLMRNKLITLVEGRARILGPRSVEAAGEKFEADAIIIATGSVSASLPIPGAELCIDSAAMLNLEEVPQRLCVIGGGVIGLEFASIYRKFGSEVTVLEFCPGVLPRFDTDLAKRLKASLAKRGIAIETSARVESVTEGLVHWTKGGNVVDSSMQTSVPDIYAIGDITGGLMLAHVASAQGRRALNHICGLADSIDFSVVPAAVFTVPEAATVGKSEEECAGFEILTGKANYRANGKAVASGEADGWCKVIAEKESRRIIGVHILGAHASDIIHEAAVLVALGATLDAASDIIHAHPTLSEVLHSAIRNAAS